MNTNESGLVASQYVKRGSYVVLRSGLPLGDKDGWPSLWLAKFGTLENFPWVEVFEQYPTRTELIQAGFETCPICGDGKESER